MLSDKHGHELKVGDKVWIPCVIVSTNPDQENDLNVETEDVAAPGKNKVPFTISAKLVTCGKKHDTTRGTPDPADDDPKPHKK